MAIIVRDRWTMIATKSINFIPALTAFLSGVIILYIVERLGRMNQSEKIKDAYRRRVYQHELGREISDRSWRRIKASLDLDSQESENRLALLKCHAYLRNKHPGKKITLDYVVSFVELKVKLLGSNIESCTGREIFQFFEELDPKPNRRTIYRWGKKIGIDFSMKKSYQSQELNEWIEWVASNPNYTKSIKLEGVSNGTN